MPDVKEYQYFRILLSAVKGLNIFKNQLFRESESFAKFDLTI